MRMYAKRCLYDTDNDTDTDTDTVNDTDTEQPAVLQKNKIQKEEKLTEVKYECKIIYK